MQSRTSLGSIRFINLLNSDDTHIILDDCFDAVEILQNMAERLNTFFTKQIFLNLFSNFISITVQLYHLIVQVRFIFSTPNSDNYILLTRQLCFNILIVFLHSFEYWIILSNGSGVKRKVKIN